MGAMAGEAALQVAVDSLAQLGDELLGGRRLATAGGR